MSVAARQSSDIFGDTVYVCLYTFYIFIPSFIKTNLQQQSKRVKKC